MKRKEKTALLTRCIGPVLLILGGIVLLWDPDFGSTAVAAILGWCLTLLGIAGVAIYFLSRPALGPGMLLVCLLMTGAGWYILTHPLALASLLGIGLGVWLLIQGGYCLWDGFALKQMGYGFGLEMLLGAAMLLFGGFLIFYPLTTSRLVMTICGGILVICGGVNLFFRIRSARYRQGTRPDIIDADE